jgi:outer membrane protein TolC
MTALPSLIRSAIFSLGCVVVLSGCTYYAVRPLRPETTAAQLDARSLSDPELRSFMETNLHRAFIQWPPAQWDFDTLTLVAFYYHPNMAVARAQWNVAQAGIKTAGGRPNPTLTVTPGYDTTHNAGLSPWFPAVNFDLPIETAGKRGHRIAVAQQLSESARLNIATVAWQVRSRLRRSLLDLYAAREAEGLLQRQQAAQAEIVRLLEAQLAAGEVSPFEATQARIAQVNTLLALRDAERQRDEAHAQIASALGLPASAVDADLSFTGLIQPPTELPSADLRRQALLHRADILGALAEYAAAESTLRLEIAKQYPDIHINPGYQFDQGDSKWSVGISIELPVLNQNQGPIAEAKAKREEVAARFIALQAGVLGDLDRTVAGYRAALGKAMTADALLANLKKQEQTIQARFEAGDISRLEMSAVQLELSQSALTRLDALVKTQQAFGELEDVLQSPVGWINALELVSPGNATRKERKHE